MTTTNAGAAPPLPLFYRDPRPLDPARHRGKSIAPLADFGFARSTNSVAITLAEFPQAALSYPIVFTAQPPRAAVAVLGLMDEQNLFLDGEGKWLAEAYIPAYLRRYPFIFQYVPERDQYVLCIDEASGMLREDATQPLFAGDKPAPAAERALKFCTDFQAHHNATHEFVDALASAGLLTDQQANIEMNDGRKAQLRGFQIVDEAKLKALPDATFLEWRRRDWLGFIYCHLLSMANWQGLVRRTAARPS
jgi:hypothetical protein